MAAQLEPEIVLYDLASTKNICFSPAVWRTRLLLNYKQIPYKTVFLEFPDIEPTLKGLGVIPPEPAPGSPVKYTVPTIHHVSSNTYIMDSSAIATFLESVYPQPPVALASDLGAEIELKARGGAIRRAFGVSLMPREARILSPRSEEYFRREREAMLGCRLEDLLSDPEREEQVWREAGEELRAVGKLLCTNKAERPFVLGARPSAADFFIAGSMQSARTVDEGVFERLVGYMGFKEVYEACLPYMEKKD